MEFTYREAARFMAKTDRTGSCWLWTAAKSQSGYGYAIVGRQTRRAHRAAYELLVGPVPAGLELDHLCRNRACVNPSHLEPVTASENSRRAGMYRRKDYCKRGHDLTATRLTDGGCRACSNAARDERSPLDRRRGPYKKRVAA